jgi:hypothetical protein
LGFIAVIISAMVLTKFSATLQEKKRARMGILLGVLGLILSAFFLQ